MVEHLDLIPCVGGHLEPAVERSGLAFLALERDELVGLQLDDERER